MAIQLHDPELVTFIHNKRTGGTSITTWLTHNFKAQKVVGKHIGFKKTNNALGNLGFTFSVVRNPWDRCVSAFFYQKRKIAERTQKISQGKTRKYKPYEIQETKEKFDYDFSTWLLANENWSFLKPQYDKINGVDLILRFETLHKDFEQIQTRLNCFNNLYHKNRSSHLDYRQYYTNETIDLVANKCKLDIEKFSYDF